jgi:hypothetical protein
METLSLKALAEKVLQRNQQGNLQETPSFRAGEPEAKKFPEKNFLQTDSSGTHGPCHICHEYVWWLSVYGVFVCGVCHPPATPDLVKRWVGNQDALSHLKGSKAGMVLSWQEIQERKAAGKREGAG